MQSFSGEHSHVVSFVVIYVGIVVVILYGRFVCFNVFVWVAFLGE